MMARLNTSTYICNFQLFSQIYYRLKCNMFYSQMKIIIFLTNVLVKPGFFCFQVWFLKLAIYGPWASSSCLTSYEQTSVTNITFKLLLETKKKYILNLQYNCCFKNQHNCDLKFSNYMYIHLSFINHPFPFQCLLLTEISFSCRTIEASTVYTCICL